MQLNYRRYARRAVPGLLAEGTRIEGLKTYFNHSQGATQNSTLTLDTISIVKGDTLELIIKSSLHDSHVWLWCVPEDGLTEAQVQSLIYNALQFDPILAAIVMLDHTGFPPTINMTGVTPGVEYEIQVGVATSGFDATFTVNQPFTTNSQCIPYGHVVTQLANSSDECQDAQLPLGNPHPIELFLGITTYCQHHSLDDLAKEYDFPPKAICSNECCGYGPQSAMKVLTEGAIWVKLEELSPSLLENTTAVPMYRHTVDPLLPYTSGSISAVDPTAVAGVVDRYEFPVDARFIEFHLDEQEGLFGLLHIDDSEVVS